MSLPFLCEVLQQNNLFAWEIRFVSLERFDLENYRALRKKPSMEGKKQDSGCNHLDNLTSDKNPEEESQGKDELSLLAHLIQSHQKNQNLEIMLLDFPKS